MSFFGGPTGRASGLKGTGYKQITTPTMNPQQSQLLQQLLGGISPHIGQSLSGLGRMASGDASQFQEMEAPSLRQHNQLLGGLASRFSGMGSGARNSSGFQNTTSEATTDLAERLAGNRMSFQQNALKQLLELSDSLLGKKSFESSLIPKEIPFWKQLMGSAAGGFGKGLGLLPKLFT